MSEWAGSYKQGWERSLGETTYRLFFKERGKPSTWTLEIWRGIDDPFCIIDVPVFTCFIMGKSPQAVMDEIDGLSDWINRQHQESKGEE